MVLLTKGSRLSVQPVTRKQFDTIQKIADDKAWKMPATIDDPAILDEITDALQTIGLAQARR